jgi:hypothetical protein
MYALLPSNLILLDVMTLIIIIIIIIISSSTVLVRTLAASQLRFLTLVRHLLGLLWTSDQPVANASTYTGQYNTETQIETFMP